MDFFPTVEECCGDDEAVGEEEFCQALQGVGENEFCRIVESQFTPYVGQQFESIEEAVEFYKMYALACGFDVRKYTTKKWRDGTIKSKLLVCNREGFTYAKKVSKCKDLEVCESTQEGVENDGDKHRRKSKVKRVGCKARVRLLMKKGVLVIDQFHAGHNHEIVEVKDREFQKLSRRLQKYHKELIVSNSRLKIGATKTFKMCKEHVSGFENIGANLTDFKNFLRDVKCYINERDGQLFIDRFKIMAETREDFYFDYEVDVDGSLIRAIWADGVGRRNYSVFGDAVSFDPTYSTNKYSMVFTPFTGVDNHKRSVTFCGALIFREKDGYFNWVFSRFLHAMGGKKPEYIITDQDTGIISSVGQIFKTARHRFCMWHIMNKVPVKYGSNAKDYPEFVKKLNAIVWDEDIEADEFDSRWGEIMTEHGIGKEREWFEEVYNKRRQWVMAHCRDLKMGSVMRTTQRSESENSFFKRFENNSGTLVEFWMRYESAIDQQRYTQKKLDNKNRYTSPKLLTQLPIESHGARVYTHVVFDVFQKEVNLSTSRLSVRGFTERNGVELTNLKDGLMGRVYDIQYKPGTNEPKCTCTMFERTGILCRHIISIYLGHGLKQIPECYVAKRWTKDAVIPRREEYN
ncbi:protein FAR1-RELATED SEQUENCE 5-like [Silene latifolia]|uniref:protein FAR1-RELATED SEQUENCE 5-like n=1 Tax=Silene latifolia TaxID=37657 RepID=UPI003D788EEF